MAESTLQDPRESTTGLPGAPQERPDWRQVLKRILKPLASLRLTVALFALAVVLVFCGTLAQIDAGIWTVLSTYFRTWYVWIPFQVFVHFGQIFLGLPSSINAPGAFLFPGGWLIGGLLLVNLLAAHTLRFKLSWRRSGIVLLHLGIIVMLLSEAVTGLYAVEGNMTIVEGGASNYVEDSRTNELAIVDSSDADYDDVVVVPESILRRGGRIRDERLPFDVEVEKYLVNSSTPTKAQSAQANPATAGIGEQFVVSERPEVSGVDPDQEADLASAYVTFLKKGTDQPLGTYLVSMHFYVRRIAPQEITVDGKTYDVELRYKRSYKPYTLHLIDFKHEKYIGTETPKNFESVVRLVDPQRKEDRQVRIYMNHPLQHAGETFYQSSFLMGDTGTVLQVVRNPGWILPYLSCAMVSGGMLMHFGMNLFVFLRRRK